MRFSNRKEQLATRLNSQRKMVMVLLLHSHSRRYEIRTLILFPLKSMTSLASVVQDETLGRKPCKRSSSDAVYDRKTGRFQFVKGAIADSRNHPALCLTSVLGKIIEQGQKASKVNV